MRYRNEKQKLIWRILALLLAIAFFVSTFFMSAGYLFGESGYGAFAVYGEEVTREDAATPVPKLDSESVLVYDLKSGNILYEKNADAQRAPASITKIMTCILVLEDIQAGKYAMTDKVTIEPEMVFQIGSHMSLRQGEVVTVEQLLNGLMICSANDAAISLAYFADGSVDAFVARMNEKAGEIGAEHTHYISTNGYTEEKTHTTTARDLKIIVDYAMEVPGFREIIDKPVYKMPKTNKSDKRVLKNTNKLFYNDEEAVVINGEQRSTRYKGVFGVKTGMMREAGYCLISGVERDGTEIIAICLKADSENNRISDAIQIMDWAFANYHTIEGIPEGKSCGKVKVKYGSRTRVKTVSDTTGYVTVPVGVEEVTWKAVPNEVINAPVKVGDVVGRVDVYAGDSFVTSVDLLAAQADKKGGPWTKYYVSDMTAYIGITALVLLIILLVIRSRLRKNARTRNRRTRQFR